MVLLISTMYLFVCYLDLFYVYEFFYLMCIMGMLGAPG